MTDYGQDLQFGIFPSPDAAHADLVLELSEAADVAGLDLVTIQDHPYQAKHLDTWTLLSVIAARTTSVRVAPNVANLPLYVRQHQRDRTGLGHRECNRRLGRPRHLARAVHGGGRVPRRSGRGSPPRARRAAGRRTQGSS